MGPVVLKPRFGSWGRGVERCDDVPLIPRRVRARARRGLVPPSRRARSGTGAARGIRPPRCRRGGPRSSERRSGSPARRMADERRAGGVRRAASDVPREAAELALASAGATGAALVGVDLLPDGRGGWIVAELNGAVEFTGEYAMWHDYSERRCARSRVRPKRVSPAGCSGPRTTSGSSPHDHDSFTTPALGSARWMPRCWSRSRFAGRAAERRGRFAEGCSPLEVEPGETLVQEGDFGYDLRDHVGAGKRSGRRRRVRTLDPGDVFGEIAVLLREVDAQRRRGQHAERLIVVMNRDVWRLEREDPAIGSALRATIAECVERAGWERSSGPHRRRLARRRGPTCRARAA